MNQLSPTSVAVGATGPPLSPVTPVPQALDALRAYAKTQADKGDAEAAALLQDWK